MSFQNPEISTLHVEALQLDKRYSLNNYINRNQLESNKRPDSRSFNDTKRVSFWKCVPFFRYHVNILLYRIRIDAHTNRKCHAIQKNMKQHQNA